MQMFIKYNRQQNQLFQHSPVRPSKALTLGGEGGRVYRPCEAALVAPRMVAIKPFHAVTIAMDYGISDISRYFLLYVFRLEIVVVGDLVEFM